MNRMFILAVLSGGIVLMSASAIHLTAQAAHPHSSQSMEQTLAIPDSESSFSERFEEAVKGWVSELSQQQEYAAWHHAQWRREPLGPGMHGWIVILSDQERAIGYMVVSMDDSGKLQLSEYGLGEYPL